MSPEQGQNFEANNEQKAKIQAMLGSITDAIGEEDFEFASETALGQTLVSPADVIDYLHIQGKNEEDPVTQRRLRDGTVSIVAALRERDQEEVTSDKERSLTEEEIRRINDVVEEINLEAAVSDEPPSADEPNVAPGQNVEPDYEWDDDVFSPDLSAFTDEEIEKAKNTAGFKAAMEIAQKDMGNGNAIGRARRIIEENGGKYKNLQLLILDEVISRAAEAQAQKDMGNGNAIGRAQGIIKKRASDSGLDDRPTSARMFASLDKYITRIALAQAQKDMGNGNAIGRARNIIENYASSPERAQAMLDELGL